MVILNSLWLFWISFDVFVFGGGSARKEENNDKSSVAEFILDARTKEFN